MKTEGKMKIINTILKYPTLYNFIHPPTKEYAPPVPDYGMILKQSPFLHWTLVIESAHIIVVSAILPDSIIKLK